MKFVKKLTALFLAVCMVMAMGITAFAEGETGDSDQSSSRTYTITGPSDGHTYQVYQILTGVLSEDGTTLSDVEAGSNYNSKKGDAAAAAEAIAKLENNTQATATTVAGYVNFDSNPIATLTDSENTASVAAGYYLIKDTGATSGNTNSYSTYVVSVVKNVTVTPKKDAPTFEKKVKDTNDTTGNTTDWQDSADYDIGDAVPFQLKGTVASNYGSYTTYFYQFTDQMEPSLTFNNSSVVVKIDGMVVDSSLYKVETGKVSSSDSYNGGDTFTVTFADLKKTAAKAGSTVTVEYNATLNENAVLGSNGNVNEAKLSYSNNPNNSQGGDTDDHGETPWDNVIVFTYQTVVNKIDQDKKPLTGAKFTLYKKLADGSQKEITAVKAESGSTFTFKGLDDGDYVLKETKTPDGYSTAADINFSVTADHDVVWSDQARTEVLNTLSGGKLDDGNITTGTITTDVVNKKGAALPSTGGMGTTVIYIAGIALIVAAGVVVVARKRMA